MLQSTWSGHVGVRRKTASKFMVALTATLVAFALVVAVILMA
jgi:hypothetical protein